MKVFNAKAIGVTKKFAAKAAMYRRAARKMGDKSFPIPKKIWRSFMLLKAVVKELVTSTPCVKLMGLH